MHPLGGQIRARNRLASFGVAHIPRTRGELRVACSFLWEVRWSVEQRTPLTFGLLALRCVLAVMFPRFTQALHSRRRPSLSEWAA